MDLDFNILRSLVTVISLFTFVGIMVWTYSRRNASDFETAANLPFDQD